MISYQEFLAATLQKSYLDTVHLRTAFDRIDYDHSGYIDKEKVKDIVGADMSEEEVKNMFTELGMSTRERLDFEAFAEIVKNNALAPNSRSKNVKGISRSGSLQSLVSFGRSRSQKGKINTSNNSSNNSVASVTDSTEKDNRNVNM